MGLSADQVKAMSMWEFNAQMIGWASQFEKSSTLSQGDKDEIWEWLKSQNDVPLSHRKEPH